MRDVIDCPGSSKLIRHGPMRRSLGATPDVALACEVRPRPCLWPLHLLEVRRSLGKITTDGVLETGTPAVSCTRLMHPCSSPRHGIFQPCDELRFVQLDSRPVWFALHALHALLQLKARIASVAASLEPGCLQHACSLAFPKYRQRFSENEPNSASCCSSSSSCCCRRLTVP